MKKSPLVGKPCKYPLLYKWQPDPKRSCKSPSLPNRQRGRRSKRWDGTRFSQHSPIVRTIPTFWNTRTLHGLANTCRTYKTRQEQFSGSRPQVKAKGRIKHQGYAGPLSIQLYPCCNRLNVKWQHRNVPSFAQGTPSGHTKATCLHRRYWELSRNHSRKHTTQTFVTPTFRSLGVRNSAGSRDCIGHRNLRPTKSRLIAGRRPRSAYSTHAHQTLISNQNCKFAHRTSVCPAKTIIL